MRRLCDPEPPLPPGGRVPTLPRQPPPSPSSASHPSSGQESHGRGACPLLRCCWNVGQLGGGAVGETAATPLPSALWLSNPHPCRECSPLPQVMNNISGPKAMFQKSASLGGRPTCPETVLPCGFGQVTRQPFIQPSPRAFPPATNQARVLGLDARPRDMGHSRHLLSATVCPGTRAWHFSCVASLLSP